LKSSMANGKGDKEPPIVQVVEVMGEEQKIIVKSNYSGYSKSMTVKTADGFFVLTITGDANLIDSGVLDVFFTSFQMR
ncbi:MAG: hypothetical protein ACI9JN_001767, partial [Bacteroidia bacterium]